jgi:hypothetical protein
MPVRNQFLVLTKYDAQALAEGLGSEGELSASQVECLGEGVSKLSQEEAEEVAFEGSTQPIEAFAKSCE